jgi:lysophospholipase L1-like esterase
LDFDQNHEGHVAMRADQVLAQAAGWVSNANPDIVLLHIGTNDIMLGQAVSGVLSEVGQIIDAIRSVKPNIKIIVAQILPVDGFDAEVAAYNSGLATLVASKTSGTSPVRLADMFSGFGSNDKYDGVHPNDTGESKMADRWYDVLATLLA